MKGFAPAAAGGATATFKPDEATILVDLVTQLADIVEHRGPPGSDPALDRLLPDAYRNSPADADEFRRFTEVDLADAKVRNALLVASALSAPPMRRGIPVVLDAAAADAWLRTLTDLRLTLGARLGVQPDGGIPFGEDAATHAVYDWLGYLQQTLVTAVDR